MTVSQRTGGKGYNRVDQNNPTENPLNEPLDPCASTPGSTEKSKLTDGIDVPQPPTEEEGGIVVVVLDTMQRKFRVGASPDWTVTQFKTYSSTVHKVPANSQRLIFMGKLLGDDETLREQNLSSSEKIVHLFPKPNVILANAEDVSLTRPESPQEATSSDLDSAHIPQIYADPIADSHLIVTTNELFEAQHRVKLLSFLLLIICSMNLLTLITIFLSPDGDSADDTPPGDPTDYATPNQDDEMRNWQKSDYFNIVLNAAGFQVALIGLRASTENTFLLSTKYLIGLIGVGVAWLGFYFYLDVEEINTKKDDADGEDTGEAVDDGNVYFDAMLGLTLPTIVWFICFLRAWQFRALIREAEQEAEERQRELHQGTDSARRRDEDDEDELHLSETVQIV
mmetsp:Transcript_34757/g.51029  ORF Transcript_34757/g.51029 Transcript_34757/m.51029 type:complete len:396 (-) Transcript_34757:476-1663(-)|eukprot:CAMPEP_0195539638 /NCGR_PEP_ID=MMETSP0794_2-20130614/50158_1 /TAXON_ID=515487 /ORGANISM="Stephanopyxis turris, Strain CCMP 815" /LENGTH=395 /DNA_ID=CAMNT_0040673679 /DNA_START=559 /DNA_END=1746 /DNA_ORIENTATION=-